MKKFIKYLVITVLFIALSIGCGFYYVLHTLNNDDPQNPNNEVSNTDEYIKGGKLNILLLGIDAGTIGAKEEYNRHRSDTMMVISIDRDEKNVKVLSIPRDTRVKIPGVGIQKINAAMAYGGPDLAVKTVKDFLGVPIHNYVVVNYQGFRDIIDAIGGVEIDIEKPMKYTDKAGGLYIDIKAGHQILNGQKAEEYVRFREYPEGDVGRVKAQQKFLKALSEALLKPSTILKLPKIIEAVQQNVETDMEPLAIASLGNLGRQLKSENLKMYILPGEGKYISGISYFIPYQNEMYKVIDEIFFDSNSITVAVLNGSGTSGIATKIAEQLKANGFKVTKIANADSFDYEKTTIIYPKEKLEDAQKVAQLFAKAELVEASEQDSETTIIIGKDIKLD